MQIYLGNVNSEVIIKKWDVEPRNHEIFSSTSYKYFKLVNEYDNFI